MVMDVIKPDAGSVLVFGKKFSDDIKDRIGYLPEERGLYRKLHIIDSMVYLATLKRDVNTSSETAGGSMAGQSRFSKLPEPEN